MDKSNSRQGFPPKFIQDLCLKKVFLKEYKEVDFNQALTGLDYLRDLEVTRRKALREAAIKLGITKDTWRTILLEDPAAYKWVQRVQEHELEIEGYYADIFIDLRIWVSQSCDDVKSHAYIFIDHGSRTSSNTILQAKCTGNAKYTLPTKHEGNAQ